MRNLSIKEKIIPVYIEEEMKNSYLSYSMSVIVGRALPDIRDGLKPVHRRILFAMYDEGLHPNKRFSKCAGVVGEVLKKYHPHGDSAVYDALVRMAQHWNLRYPLVEGQGNFGSIDGDAAAAYYRRCLEARLGEGLSPTQWQAMLDLGDFVDVMRMGAFRAWFAANERAAEHRLLDEAYLGNVNQIVRRAMPWLL